MVADASKTLDTHEAQGEEGTVEAIAGYASFGKFQLVARLGKGGMGDVYLALARGMEGFKKLVVIKRLHETLIDDAFMGEGRREADAADVRRALRLFTRACAIQAVTLSALLVILGLRSAGVWRG